MWGEGVDSDAALASFSAFLRLLIYTSNETFQTFLAANRFKKEDEDRLEGIANCVANLMSDFQVVLLTNPTFYSLPHRLLVVHRRRSAPQGCQSAPFTLSCRSRSML